MFDFLLFCRSIPFIKDCLGFVFMWSSFELLLFALITNSKLNSSLISRNKVFFFFFFFASSLFISFTGSYSRAVKASLSSPPFCLVKWPTLSTSEEWSVLANTSQWKGHLHAIKSRNDTPINDNRRSEEIADCVWAEFRHVIMPSQNIHQNMTQSFTSEL